MSVNIEKSILEYFYKEYLKSSKLKEIDVVFEELNLNVDLKIPFSFTVDRLIEMGYIGKRSYMEFYILFDGVVYFETIYLPFDQYKFIRIYTIILDLLVKIEKKEFKIQNNELSTRIIRNILEIKEFIFDEREIFDLIWHFRKEDIITDNLQFKGAGLSETMNLLSPNSPILTNRARDFLNYNRNRENLFQSVTNQYSKQLLLQEYSDIEELRKREKWKDIAIKMGSILDYLTYDYFEQNNISIPNKKKPNFYDRILYIQQNNLIGDPNDWFKAKILKDFRNFVHLQELVKQNYVFNEETIDFLYQIFEKLILLF